MTQMDFTDALPKFFTEITQISLDYLLKNTSLIKLLIITSAFFQHYIAQKNLNVKSVALNKMLWSILFSSLNVNTVNASKLER